jgi:hypothetical protein
LFAVQFLDLWLARAEEGATAPLADKKKAAGAAVEDLPPGFKPEHH